MAKYGKLAERKVRKAMRERKRGTLRSGGNEKKLQAASRLLQLAFQKREREEERYRLKSPAEKQ